MILEKLFSYFSKKPIMGKDDVREVSNKETKSLFGMIFQVLKSFFFT